MKSVSETQALQEAAEKVRAAAMQQKIPESHKRLRSFSRKATAGSVEDDNIFELPKDSVSAGAQGAAVLVAISDIEDSPYQTIPLNEAKVADLVRNLATNPLSSPIVLRRLPDGKLQLIAGRHRVEAYKRLSREEIESTIKELTDDQAEKLVFYDNLFAPNLSDYEKYLGFLQRKKTKNLTGEQLADEAGISAATVSKLLGFAELSNEIHTVLKKHPNTIGASNVRNFAQLASSNEELAIKAIEKIAAGEMTQKAALDWMKTGGEKPKKKTSDLIETPIRIGKSRYATVRLSADRLMVSFASEDEALEMNYVIEKLLQERAKAIAQK